MRSINSFQANEPTCLCSLFGSVLDKVPLFFGFHRDKLTILLVVTSFPGSVRVSYFLVERILGAERN